MKKNIRPGANNKFVSGDIVYYKRNDCRKWKGPGKVIGSDSSNVLIKHGSNYLRVHACRVMMDRVFLEEIQENTPGKPCERELSENVDEKQSLENIQQEESESEEEDKSSEISIEDGENEEKSSINSKDKIVKTVNKLKKGMKIEFVNKNGEAKSGEVLRRTGKATGKYKDFWYIKENSGEVIEYDTENDWETWKEIASEESEEFEECEEIHILDEETEIEKKRQIFQAKITELEKWREENVVQEVEDRGQTTVSTTWVITVKKEGNEEKVKARLVARGYEEENKVRSDSPTCRKESIRMMLVFATSMGWRIHSLDVKAAFLQGQNIQREVFIRPPKEFKKPNTLWKLQKVVYGLNDASRSWYLKVKEVLDNLGMKPSNLDKSVFIPKTDGLDGYIVIHVDDLLFFGSVDFMKKIMDPFKSMFKISKEEKDAFKYVGIKLSQEDTKIKMDQNQYMEKLRADCLSPGAMKDKDRSLDEQEKKIYKQAVGQLGWLATISKPEASYMYCVLSTVQCNPKVRHFIQYRKIVNELKSLQSSIALRPLNLASLKVVAYSDASFGSLEGGASQLGYIVFIQDSNGDVAPISWCSKKAKRICRSALTAETLAAVEAIDAASVIKKMIEDILCKEIPPVVLCIDSKSLFDTCKTSNMIADRRLLIDVSAIREMVDNQQLVMKWVKTTDQLADVLTKNGVNKLKLTEVISSGKLTPA